MAKKYKGFKGSGKRQTPCPKHVRDPRLRALIRAAFLKYSGVDIDSIAYGNRIEERLNSK